MKEFDYEKAKAGAPVCTRDGKPARIIFWDARSATPNGDHYPIVALIEEENGIEYPNTFAKNGLSYLDRQDPDDLMMADIKHEGYVIMCKAQFPPYAILHNAREDFTVHCRIFPSEQAAKEAAELESFPYETIAHIEWTE